MKNLIKLGVGIFAFSLFAIGCQKEEVTEPITDEEQSIQSAEDYAEAETSFEDAFELVDMEAQRLGDLTGFTNTKGAKVRNECMEMTIEKNDNGLSIFPITVTMDFGDGCETDRGRKISGKMIVVFSDRLRKKGATKTITFENFVVNGHKVSGTRITTNNGLNDKEQFSYTIELKDGVVEGANGKVVKHEFIRTLTWVEGMGTNFKNDGEAGILDDVWEITGNANGVNRNGVAYTAEILTPLRKANACKWITAGELKITSSKYEHDAVINYGDGTCDNLATVTVNGRTKEIELPKKR